MLVLCTIAQEKVLYFMSFTAHICKSRIATPLHLCSCRLQKQKPELIHMEINAMNNKEIYSCTYNLIRIHLAAEKRDFLKERNADKTVSLLKMFYYIVMWYETFEISFAAFARFSSVFELNL